MTTVPEHRKDVIENISTVKVFTAKTVSPPDALIDIYSMVYMEGFNNPPWDIYEYNLTPQKAQKELNRLISIVIKSNGAFLSIMFDGSPAGFTLITDMSIFSRQLEQVVEFRRLPKDFINPSEYLKKLSETIETSIADFFKVGYVAIIAVDKQYRGRGLGRNLMKRSLEYFREQQKYSAWAWSINPAMIKIFQDLGCRRVPNLGQGGEGIDLLVQGNVWYPTLEHPKREISSKGDQIIAEHWLKSVLPD
jgi:GNAT superfamily N-acetyltransferase